MHATIRRYEGVDLARTDEVVSNVNETLVPQLRELDGFSGYYLLDAGNGVLSSFSMFDNAQHADEATQLVATWVRDEKFESILPNAPKISIGEVIAQKNGVATA